MDEFSSPIIKFEEGPLYGFRLPAEKYLPSPLKVLMKLFLWLSSIFLILFGIGIFTTFALWFYERKQYQKPENIFNRSLIKAYKYAAKGQYDKALQLLEKAEKINKDNVDLQELKGICLFQLEDYEQAKIYLESVARIRPSDRVNVLLSEIYAHSSRPEDWEKAVDIYRAFAERMPGTPNILYLLGYFLYKTGDFDKAIAYLQKIPPGDEKYLKALNLIAACFIEKNDWKNAARVLHNAPLRKRHLDDDLKNIHYTLGRIYEETGAYEKALKHYNKVLIEDIEFSDIRERVAKLRFFF